MRSIYIKVEGENMKVLGLNADYGKTNSQLGFGNIKHPQLGEDNPAKLFSLRKLKQTGLPSRLLIHFYSSTIENKRDLFRLVKTAQKIVGTPLPTLDHVYNNPLRNKVQSINLDNIFPLPSGKRYRTTVKAQTNRMRNSFFPRAVPSVKPPTSSHIVQNVQY